MGERYFKNDMPEMVEEMEEAEVVGFLGRLLSLPYASLSDMLKRSALDLKQMVVRETWRVESVVGDYSLYTGALGTACLAFKAYHVSKDMTDLQLCCDIVKACDVASRDSGHVTFICGRAGVCALGAVVAKHAGDGMLLDHYLSQFNEIKLSSDLPNELLYGRAGCLWACSFLNKNIGSGTVSTSRIKSVVDEITKAGRRLAKKGQKSPLMYEWHGKKYWGFAHGLAGIMYVLMTVQLKPEEVEDVKGTLRYMIKNCFTSGNYPSSEGSESDRLVHWCHGAPGVALTLVKAAEIYYMQSKDMTDLQLCCDIVKACDVASRDSGHVTFICGRAGVCALGAVVAKHVGDGMLLDHYLSQFNEIKLSSDLPNELLYGRAGCLWACSFLNKNIGSGTVSTSRIKSVVDEITKAGRRLAKKGQKSPLMYEWHGKKYWGFAHGLAGIMYVLMTVQLKPEEVEDVKGTLRYMIKNCFTSGNYPSSEGSESDRLVHWCHGAPGVALTLVKAAEIFGDEEFVQAAIDAGEVVWRRGLLKRVGLCHGISGNTYVFLALYRITGKVEYFYKAKAFACFLLDRAPRLLSEGKMHGGDRPYSLFEGVGGMCHLFLDMTEPSEARFPGYEI